MSLRRTATTALALAAVLALTGCTPPAAEPTAWQGVVQTLASQASGGDYASASATLDQLDADVTAQRDAGSLSAAEAEAILARIAVVRADLSSLLPAPEPTAESTPEPTTESTTPVVEDTPDPTQSTVGDDDASDDEPTPPGDSATPDEPGGKGPGNTGPGRGGPGQDRPGGPGKKDG